MPAGVSGRAAGLRRHAGREAQHARLAGRMHLGLAGHMRLRITVRQAASLLKVPDVTQSVVPPTHPTTHACRTLPLTPRCMHHQGNPSTRCAFQCAPPPPPRLPAPRPSCHPVSVALHVWAASPATGRASLARQGRGTRSGRHQPPHPPANVTGTLNIIPEPATAILPIKGAKAKPPMSPTAVQVQACGEGGWERRDRRMIGRRSAREDASWPAGRRASTVLHLHLQAKKASAVGSRGLGLAQTMGAS